MTISTFHHLLLLFLSLYGLKLNFVLYSLALQAFLFLSWVARQVGWRPFTHNSWQLIVVKSGTLLLSVGIKLKNNGNKSTERHTQILIKTQIRWWCYYVTPPVTQVVGKLSGSDRGDTHLVEVDRGERRWFLPNYWSDARTKVGLTRRYKIIYATICNIPASHKHCISRPGKCKYGEAGDHSWLFSENHTRNIHETNKQMQK